jgi:hypothetical protein
VAREHVADLARRSATAETGENARSIRNSKGITGVGPGRGRGTARG